LVQPSPSSATPFESLRGGAGRRTLAVGLALLIEAVLLLALLSLGSEKWPGKTDEAITVVNLRANAVPQDVPEPSRPEPAAQADEPPAAQRPPTEEPPPSEPAEPMIPQLAEAQAPPTAPPVLPSPNMRPPSADRPRDATRREPAGGAVYGPVDPGRSSMFRDSERVGTAPNGEPLYAAAWYREPEERMLRDYLSTARGPGWGLIACRTAPNYRVEDCVGLDEYPQGSQIARAVLAAAWEFRVRPPRLGGQPQVGSWVRIRIDYGIERR
jgi:periplasmic protein TonB